MKLTRDYVHTFEALWEQPGKCRIRVYEEQNKPMVFVCTELPENRSGSIVTVVEHIATQVWTQEGKPETFIWIEHYPSEVAPDGVETFHSVKFARPLGSRFFSPEWEQLTREEVEKLVGNRIK